MKLSLALLLAVADAILAAIAGLAAPLALAAAIWASRGFPVAGMPLAGRLGADAWLLAHGAAVDVVIDPTMGPALGAEEILRFPIAVAPLGLALITVLLAWRAGRRALEAGSGVSGALAATAAFAAVAGVVAQLASHPYAEVPGVRAVVGAAIVYGVPALAGARAWERPLRDLELGPVGAYALRAARGMVAGLVAAAGVALLAALAAGMGRLLGVFQSMHLDPLGVVAVGVAMLALLPNLLVWALAWLAGPGVELGAGSLISPFGTNVAPMPLVPAFGLIPEGDAPWLIAFMLLPALAGLVGALAPRMADEGEEPLGLGPRALGMAIAAAGAAVLAALAALAAGGAVGPGRLQTVGPEAWWTGLAVFGLLLLGGLPGALAPTGFFLGEVGLGRLRGDGRREPDGEDDGGELGDSAGLRAAGEAGRDRDGDDDRDGRWGTGRRDDDDLDGEGAGDEGLDDDELDDEDWADEDEDEDEDEDGEAAPLRGDAADDPADGDREARPSGRGARAARGSRRGGRVAGGLAEAVRRDDEPDIYADIDPEDEAR